MLSASPVRCNSLSNPPNDAGSMAFIATGTFAVRGGGRCSTSTRRPSARLVDQNRRAATWATPLRPSCLIDRAAPVATAEEYAGRDDLRSVAPPHDAEAVERQLLVDRRDRLRVGCDQIREAAGRDDGDAVDAELVLDARDDRVDLAGEAVDEPRLYSGNRRLADHALGRDERDARQPRGAREERVHRDLPPGREDPAGELPRRLHV